MTNWSLAHNAGATATLYSGFLHSIGRDPGHWQWPASTAEFLRHRIEALAAELVQTGATVAVTA